jgi:hypothetical protein
MARLVTCGFEAKSASEWGGTEGTAPVFSTTVKNSGTASARFQNTTASARSIRFAAYADDETGKLKNVFIRAYVRLDTAPAAQTAILAWDDTTGIGTASFYGIKINTNRTLICTSSTGTTGTASAALTLGTWYRLEMNYNEVAKQATPYLNGTAWASPISADLGGGHWARFGIINSTTADIYFDDIAVNDSTGTIDNGLPGAISTSTGVPAKVWTGSAWATKPVKVWTGSAWAPKTVRVRTSTAWR